MDKIINILLLTIIFVFDPLAIALVVAANYAFERLRPKTKENIYGEKFVDEDLFEEGEDWKEETVHLDMEEILNSEEEEDDWKIEDEDKPKSKPFTPYGGEIDTESIRRAKPPKKNNDEDLTITY